VPLQRLPGGTEVLQNRTDLSVKTCSPAPPEKETRFLDYWQHICIRNDTFWFTIHIRRYFSL